MNSSIYGSRSIIPNNYYFTFDAIYENESSAYEHKEDILIGRCVLATKTNTVLLRTVSGYLRVAKLDNEGRFIYSEGMTVDGSFNIDNPSSNGNTIHGIGTYLVPFNIASEKRRQDTGKKIAYSTLTDEDWENGFLKPASQGYFQTVDTSKDNSKTYYIKNNDKYEQFLGDSFSENTTYYEKEAAINEVIGTWPIIKGCTQEQYLKDNEFVLEFFADSINVSEFAYITTITTTIDANTSIKQQQWKDANNNLLVFDKVLTDSNLSKIETNLSIVNKQITPTPRAEVKITVNTTTNNNDDYVLDVVNYPLTEASFNCFQILRNSSIDKKDISITDLNHFDKTFIRHGTITYKILTQENYDDVISQIDKIYEFNSASGGFVEVSNQSNIKSSLSKSEYRYFYREIDWKESWQDTSEQYTGYLGYLNPYSEGNKLPSNTAYSPAKYPFSKENIYFTKNSSSNKYNQVTTNITEANFNDTLIEVFIKVESNEVFDEDKQYYTKSGTTYSKAIGLTSFLPNIQYYYKDSVPVSDTYYVKNNSNNNNTTDSITLVEAINKLDKIIGSKTRFNLNSHRKVNSISYGNLSSVLNEDERDYQILEDNIMDALVKHDADIGYVDFTPNNDNTYNLNFVKDGIYKEGETRDTTFAHVNSLTEAIRKLDHILGYQDRLNKTDNNAKVNNPFNKCWGVSGSGQSYKKTSDTTLNSNKIYYEKSPENGYVQITPSANDNPLEKGYYERIDDANIDKRSYNISESNIIDAIVHHDADIGSIENISPINGNTYNLNFVKDGEYKEGQTDQFGNIISTTYANINSLTEAIQKIDHILGYQNRLNKPRGTATVNLPNGAWSVTGSGAPKYNNWENANDKRYYKIEESNIIDTIVHHDADIGPIEDIKSKDGNTYNLNFVSTGTSSNLGQEDTEVANINSLTEAVQKIDHILGSQNRLKRSSTIDVGGNSEWDVTGKGANDDSRPYKIDETNIIDAIVKLAADIGTNQGLWDSRTSNNNFTYIGDDSRDTEYLDRASSLADAIEILDKYLGTIKDIFTESDNRNFIGVSTVKDALLNLNSLIGEFFNLGTDQINGISYLDSDSIISIINQLNKNVIGQKSGITKGDLNGSAKTISKLIDQIGEILGKRSNISSDNSELSSAFDLTTLINKIGQIIGSRNSINTPPNNISTTQSLFQMINALDSALGNVDYQEFDNKKGLASVVKEIYTKYTDYAKYINNLAENMNFTQMQVAALTAQLSGLTGGADSTQLTWKQLPN